MRMSSLRIPYARRCLVGALCALWASTASAGNYPLGTMTCADIGRYASETMAAKKAGRTLDDALAALEAREYADPVEKRNLTDVTYILFGNRGRNLGVESAGKIMQAECEFGRTPPAAPAQ